MWAVTNTFYACTYLDVDICHHLVRFVATFPSNCLRDFTGKHAHETCKLRFSFVRCSRDSLLAPLQRLQCCLSIRTYTLALHACITFPSARNRPRVPGFLHVPIYDAQHSFECTFDTQLSRRVACSFIQIACHLRNTMYALLLSREYSLRQRVSCK
jgi:hypothetical protein